MSGWHPREEWRLPLGPVGWPLLRDRRSMADVADFGALLGALLMGSLNNGMSLMNVPPFYQDTARGIVLLLVVAIDQLGRRRAVAFRCWSKSVNPEIEVPIPCRTIRPKHVTIRCSIGAAAGAACSCRRSRSGCGTISAGHAACDEAGDLPHGLRSRHHPFRSRQQLRPAARLGRDRFRRHPARRFRGHRDELVDLDQGRLSDVARPLRRMGQPQIPAREPRPEPEAAWGSTMSTSSIRTASIPTRRWKRRWARSIGAVRQGKALYVGISSYNAQRTRGGGRDPAPARHALRHPPAELFDAQPLDRADRLLDTLEEEGDRLHRLLAAGPGHADRQISRGIPHGSRAAQGKSLRQAFLNDATICRHHGPQRDRPAARPVAGPDGDRLGAARRARDLGADRRQPAGAGRGLRRRSGIAGLQRRASSRRSTGSRGTAASICGRPRASMRARRAPRCRMPRAVRGKLSVSAALPGC